MEAKKPNDTMITVVFPVRAGWVVGLMIIALTVAYWFATKSFRETVLFLAASAAAGGAILGAFFSGRAVAVTTEAMERTREATLKLSQETKRVRALDVGRRWNDPNMFHVRDACRVLFDMEASKKAEILALAREKTTNLIHMLNFLEEMAIQISADIADETILKEQFGGIVALSWARLEEWICEHRKLRGRPKQWMCLQTLAQKWNSA